MRKATLNYVIFIGLLLLSLGQGVSGCALAQLASQGGYQGGRGTVTETAFLWERHDWITIHDWVAIALLVIVIVHIILHWRWIIAMTKRGLSRKK